MNPNTLLADPSAIAIDKFISNANSITIVAHSIQQSALCPLCGLSSDSLKAHYIRRLADLPWHNVAIRLELKARKFRCRNSLCPKKVFCERLRQVVSPYARRTIRLTDALTVLAFALGGRGAVRTIEKLPISAIGKDTLLNLVRRHSAETSTSSTPSVRVLGVDDFAFRKGCTYGTILVDLEKRRPIDLLADREAETLARWLRDHPSIEVVTRDRSPIYAEGITTGLPKAVQVADRWHLLKNLRESGRRFLMRENKLLQEAARHLIAAGGRATEVSWRRRVSLTSRPKNMDGENERRCLYQQVVELHKGGLSGRAIARTLGLHRATIRRFIENDEYPARVPRALRPSLLDPYIDYLEKRLRESCWNAGQLWREVRTRGYPGGTKMVSRYVTARRVKSPCPSPAEMKPEIRLPLPVPSVEQVSWWLVLEPGKLKPDEKKFLASLSQVNEQIGELIRLSRELVEIIKRQDENGLTVWLDRARSSQVKEMRGFAFGIIKDEAAVRQAVTSQWSNVQTEGQVNRLKTIKRQMYGRANFDLLKARVIHQG